MPGTVATQVRILVAYSLWAASAVFVYAISRDSFISTLAWRLLPFALASTLYDKIRGCVQAHTYHMTMGLLLFTAGDAAVWIQRTCANDPTADGHGEQTTLHFAMAYFIISEAERFRSGGSRDTFMSQRALECLDDPTIRNILTGAVLHLHAALLYVGLAWILRSIVTGLNREILSCCWGVDVLFIAVPFSQGESIQFFLLGPLRILACSMTDDGADLLLDWWERKSNRGGQDDSSLSKAAQDQDDTSTGSR
ncbi:hypothetical protein BDV96DRAFT_563665 [Lophiotrema nucula]|uniref:Uncharacterized protein n=1 Tax=Lophiotrema nucula TaxID=690887 RepID=A0A6A5ZNX2_9PLEO|nr:hypothetical protein BDV96DRAFT_563665 [Lophiotrema nucula]